MRWARRAAPAVALLAACTLDLPAEGPGPCGALGERCCAPAERAQAGAACVAGATCEESADPDAVLRCVCAPGETACGGRCVNLARDVANCGACGLRCAEGRTCAAGACACAAGRYDCDAAHEPACESTVPCR